MINNKEQDSNYVVISIGSNRISGMIAKKNSMGVVTPLAVHSENSRSAVRYGVIHNIDEASTIFTKIIKELQNHVSDRENIIEKVYIGLNARSMYSYKYHANLNKEDEAGASVKIEDEDLKKLRKQVDAFEKDGFTKVMVSEATYYIDGKKEYKPVGIKARSISATYQVVLLRSSIVDDIKELLDSIHIGLAGFLVTPIAETYVSLNADDYTQGSTFINIGSSTSSVSIFNERNLVAMYILPLGANNVTNDLMSLNISYSDAEKLKKEYCNISKAPKKDEYITVGNKQIPKYDIYNIVLKRYNEIMLNVLNILKESSYDYNIVSIVMSGGGVLIAGFNEYIHELFTDVSYRFASFRREIVDDSAKEFFTISNLSTIGLIALAKEPCTSRLATLEDLDDNKDEVNRPESTSATAEDINVVPEIADDDTISNNGAEDIKDDAEISDRNKPKDKSSNLFTGMINKIKTVFSGINSNEDDIDLDTDDEIEDSYDVDKDEYEIK